MPDVLNSVSIEQYNEQGYTGPIRVFSEDYAAALRKHFFTTIGQSEGSPAPTKAYMSAWHHQHRWAYDMAADPRILDALEPFVGPNIVMWAMHFWYKAPRTGVHIPWHQDAAYWHLTPKKNVTAWVALGPTFLANGCLRILPGTHRSLVEHAPTGDPNSSFANGLPRELIDESRALDLPMQPGEMVIFNEATYHGSKANTSDTARVAFSMRYTSPDVKFEMEKWSDPGRIKTFLVRGADDYHLNDAIRGAPPK
jgi:ectoine hydroxylase-related dioxygenase (phytanoyl-CoA dioxygenase family)